MIKLHDVHRWASIYMYYVYIPKPLSNTATLDSKVYTYIMYTYIMYMHIYINLYDVHR